MNHCIQLENHMLTRPFLNAHPVLALGHSDHRVTRALEQYVRLPEEIAEILSACARHFPPKSPVHRELLRNVAQERGRDTGGVAHVEILRHILQDHLGIDTNNTITSETTEVFITGLYEGTRLNASYALGVAFALEASAVPELRAIVGPLVNAAAARAGRVPPVLQATLIGAETRVSPRIRTRAQALAMNADEWFAMHIYDFEVSHRDNLRQYATAFLRTEGDCDEFAAGFMRVMDLMDAWWHSLST